MSSSQVTTGDRIIDPMIALAGCSTRQRIVVAGSKSMEVMLELHRRGYLLAAATGNCGLAATHASCARGDDGLVGEFPPP
jgi:1-deoxy-D-xylulose 5-phosphate reductoisomerase